MDREQEERQFLGFFGIVKESIKIISTWRKIFSQITLAFILPLSLIFLAHIEVSAFLFAKITPEYNEHSDFMTSNAIELLLFTVVYIVLVVIFSLLSKSAVVSTITCVYTSGSITFRGVMRVFPKAMFKSKNLINGKLGISIAINLLLAIGSMAIQTVCYIFVACGHGSGLLRLGVAVLCFLLLLKLLLFSHVAQTVIYFVCKSYHHENIDKSPLADHLEVHLLAEYLPHTANDV
ncbi:hypothetical protein NL676_019579 [Syzygium grande]|nr:hypothetical protein NL676_019579 [Syzygium grande]